MLRTLCASIALIVLTSIPVGAQKAVAPNARAVLQAADANMGASKLHSVHYSAIGYASQLGAGYSSSPDDTWPRFELKNYSRTIDYPSLSSHEEQLRVHGAWLPRGGATEFTGEWRQAEFVSGNFAWDVSNRFGDDGPTQSTQAEIRQVQIMMTPHGFIRAALAAKDVKVSQRSDGARMFNVVSFKAFGRYTLNGWINADNVVTKTQTWLPHPILGDMFVELSTKNGYKDYGGIKFPGGLRLSTGNPPRPALDIDIIDVKPNIPGAVLQVPSGIERATAQPLRPIESRQLAPGIWFLSYSGGAAYNSMAVEFRDYVVVLEAPHDQELGFALIDESKRLIPNKPIRYVVNTHHHFDPAGGLRAFGAEGATIVTHRSNLDFYDGVAFDLRPRTLQPDPLSVAPRQVHYVLVDGTHTITDGDQTVTLYHMEGLEHSSDMLVAWLPKAKILYHADLFNPRQVSDPLPKPPAIELNLLYNLQRVRIEPETFVSLHGGVIPASQFTKQMGINSILAHGSGSNAALGQ